MSALSTSILSVTLVIGRLAAAGTFPEPTYELIAPDVVAATVKSERPRLVFHVVKADLRKGGLEFGAIKAQGKETLAQIAQRLLDAKRPLLVAINGDYFERDTDNGRPWGGHVEKGEIFFSPTGKSVFLIDAQGKPLIDVPTLKLGVRFDAGGAYQKVAAVNRPRPPGDNGLYIYTPVWGPNVQPPAGGVSVALGGGPLIVRETIEASILGLSLGRPTVAVPEGGFVLVSGDRSAKSVGHLKVGGVVAIRGELAPAATEAVGGGPRLVRAGKPTVEFKEEAFEGSHAQYLTGRHPRAAAGYTKARDVLVLAVVEGRSAESDGLTMTGLAQLMIELGASDAMAFDGGGSATLYAAGKMLATGGGAGGGGGVEERRLGNALGLFVGKRKTP